MPPAPTICLGFGLEFLPVDGRTFYISNLALMAFKNVICVIHNQTTHSVLFTKFICKNIWRMISAMLWSQAKVKEQGYLESTLTVCIIIKFSSYLNEYSGTLWVKGCNDLATISSIILNCMSLVSIKWQPTIYIFTKDMGSIAARAFRFWTQRKLSGLFQWATCHNPITNMLMRHFETQSSAFEEWGTQVWLVC